MSEHGIRIGVVGAGYWGPNLIRVCAELGVLDSVCDIDDAALEAVRQSYPNVATTTRFNDLLARPTNAVIIAAPAALHAEMALTALGAGKHIFVEKPLALNVSEGMRIERAADASGRSVFVGHVLLYHPAIKKLRSMIAEGVIGDVRHIRSRRLSLGKLRSHENVWWSFAPHDVALLLTLFGEEPYSVTSAQAHCRDTNISDFAYADFEFPGGRSGHIEVSWLDPEKSARLDVFGTSGVLTLTDSRKGSSLTLKPFKVSTNDRGALTVIRGEEQIISFESQEPLRAEIEAFVSSVVSGKPSVSDAKLGIAVLRALSMAEEAVRDKPERALA